MMAAHRAGEMGPFNIDTEITSSLNDMSDEELCSFAELQEDPVNDDQIELYIYACFLIFTRTRLTGYLEQAIQRIEGWIAVQAIDHPDRARRFQILNTMSARMSQPRLMEEFGLLLSGDRVMISERQTTNAVMSIDRRTGQVSPYDEVDIQIIQAVELMMAYERTGNMDDLNEAIRMTEQVITMRIETSALGNLAGMLGTRFERTGSIDDLNRAVEVANMAVEFTPQGHPDRTGMLSNLGTWLGRRFERIGSMDDLNRAVEVANIAVESTPKDYPDRAGMLSNLGNWLATRFDRTGLIDDLNSAVEASNMAVEGTPRGHPDRASYLNNLGTKLGRRFERTGVMDDLNRAVEVTNMAVEATTRDHPARGSILNNLGIQLAKRFEQTSSMDDLNRAIEAANMAVETPRHHPDRAGWLSSLGSWLGRRFERTGSMDDLNRAIDVSNMAVEATPQGHSDRASRLNNLGSKFGRRFRRTDSIDDLNRAVELATMAVESTPQNHSDQAGRLSNLATWLATRFERTSSIDDLNRAIIVTSKAVDATPQDHPSQAGWLNNLGIQLSRRFDRTGSIDDLNRALSSFKEGWACRIAPSSIRISLAQNAARILVSQLNWEEASLLLEDAVTLLPNVSPRSLRHTDKQHTLATFAGLASMAAVAALNAGKPAHHALQLLELGRGVIAGLIMEMRDDISALKQQYPSLADEFVALRDELDVPTDQTIATSFIDTASSWESQNKRRRKAEQEFDKLRQKIRDRPGFHRFQLPPTAEEMMAATDLDPIIVVNLSPHRCDAFLIEPDQIRVLELPDLRLEEVQQRVHDLRSYSAASFHIEPMLRWLWDVIARPCLEALSFKSPVSDGSWRRIWWVPTGLLSHLPFHAAGYHVPGSTETVLDRVMSSYASSIKALIHGRRHHSASSSRPPSDKALLVAMRETPGLNANQILPFAATEVQMLNSFCPSLQLKPVSPALRKDDVLKHLQSCRIFHFAGHGQSDPTEPSKSCLLLEDWETDPLTVGDLRDHRLQENPPFLGYLSACSTGVNEDDKLADEGVHLVSAFQLAGFRHVVGTLWEVSDRHCLDMAKRLYETLRDEGIIDKAVCRGVHFAVRALRNEQIGDETNRQVEGGTHGQAKDKTDRNAALMLDFGNQVKTAPASNFYWVPYIHYGI